MITRMLEKFRRMYFGAGQALNGSIALEVQTVEVDPELKEKISRIAHASDNASMEFEAISRQLRRQAMALEQLGSRLGGEVSDKH